MRSFYAQRLLSSLLASTSSRGGGALGPTSTSRSAAAQAAWGQTCQFQARQSARPFAQLVAQRSGPRTLPGNNAATSDRRPHAWREQLGSLATLCWRLEQQQQEQQQRWQQHGRCLHTSPAVRQDFVTLNNLQDNEGARRWVRISSYYVPYAAAHCCHCSAVGHLGPYARPMEAASHAFTHIYVRARPSELGAA